MTDDEKTLPNDIEQLKAMLLAERKQSAQQTARLVFLEEQFRLAQQQRFGASSEGHPAQGDLFNEAEAELDVIEDTVESTPTTVKKKSVLAVVRHYIKWANRVVKSLSLSRLKSKLLSMFDSNIVAERVKKKVLALKSKVSPYHQVQSLKGLRRPHC